MSGSVANQLDAHAAIQTREVALDMSWLSRLEWIEETEPNRWFSPEEQDEVIEALGWTDHGPFPKWTATKVKRLDPQAIWQLAARYAQFAEARAERDASDARMRALFENRQREAAQEAAQKARQAALKAKRVVARNNKGEDTMTLYKIEKGVTFPVSEYNIEKGVPYEKYPFDMMEDGDSFTVTKPEMGEVRLAIGRWHRDHPNSIYHLRTRSIEDGLRIWKIREG
jgi:hypothetical protein